MDVVERRRRGRRHRNWCGCNPSGGRAANCRRCSVSAGEEAADAAVEARSVAVAIEHPRADSLAPEGEAVGIGRRRPLRRIAGMTGNACVPTASKAARTRDVAASANGGCRRQACSGRMDAPRPTEGRRRFAQQPRRTAGWRLRHEFGCRRRTRHPAVALVERQSDITEGDRCIDTSRKTLVGS